MRLGLQSVFAYDHEPAAASSEVWTLTTSLMEAVNVAVIYQWPGAAPRAE